MSHNGAGDLTTLMAPNTGEQSWSYEGPGRITGTTWISGTTSLFTQTVTLDGAGQRMASNDSWGSTTFGYDAVGRLTSASYPDGSTEADQYDASGNRTVITGTTTPSGTSVLTNTYDLADELTGTAGTGGSTTFSYDGNGNQTFAHRPRCPRCSQLRFHRCHGSCTSLAGPYNPEFTPMPTATVTMHAVIAPYVC